MNQLACRYAVVQFVPYLETGEFVNAGLVLICPRTGYFGYRLQRRKYARITGFFDELPRRVFLHAMDLIDSELRRVATLITNTPCADRETFLRQVFDRLLHPREAIVRFSTPRALLTDDPAAELNHQFERHVHRAFATPEYIEYAVEKRIRALLGTLNLEAPFKPAKVGDDLVHARFPLVQHRGERPAKIIKPLNLTQLEPTDIYEHGDAWLQKLRRLRDRGLLPPSILFALAAPEPGTKRFVAYEEIQRELVAQGVLTADQDANSEISRFALQ